MEIAVFPPFSSPLWDLFTRKWARAHTPVLPLLLEMLQPFTASIIKKCGNTAAAWGWRTEAARTACSNQACQPFLTGFPGIFWFRSHTFHLNILSGGSELSTGPNKAGGHRLLYGFLWVFTRDAERSLPLPFPGTAGLHSFVTLYFPLGGTDVLNDANQVRGI